MILSTKYLIRMGDVEMVCNSPLEMKVTLSKITSAMSTTIRVYKSVVSLNTTTHTVSVVETELTE